MKANLNKRHLLLSTNDAFNFEISETVIRNSNSKKLLGVTFDNKLKFQKHIITICQRANRKLNAQARLYGTGKETYGYECIFQFSV